MKGDEKCKKLGGLGGYGSTKVIGNHFQDIITYFQKFKDVT